MTVFCRHLSVPNTTLKCHASFTNAARSLEYTRIETIEKKLTFPVPKVTGSNLGTTQRKSEKQVTTVRIYESFPGNFLRTREYGRLVYGNKDCFIIFREQWLSLS